MYRMKIELVDQFNNAYLAIILTGNINKYYLLTLRELL